MSDSTKLGNKPLHPLIPPTKTAETLGVSPGTLQVWRSTGRYNLPFVKVGGRVMYRPDDVQAFIERRTMEHTV
ncbi:MAG: helix-turn-helix domain-containing protein [Candidatus Thiodiazotropha sp. (ex Ctena orbiculata)]|uniref:Helix-turn-helix domain-containing protein n=1 Tax=Candidatus Thiodiazotropha taylori TaxID=2792791 RepID=A0A944MBI7_9GAMM|nr:helix-turn-helix domain-containing protein [Candidatus Thiodiazotropha taylori]MBV2138794.1 helix-turn-helix domain-containing protein [Candidatus Thiodiazotropha taylori]